MKIRLNEDKEVVNEIRTLLKKNDGHCPCKLDKTPDTKCMCKDFREQIDNPNFEGYCHCELYYKEK